MTAGPTVDKPPFDEDWVASATFIEPDRPPILIVTFPAVARNNPPLPPERCINTPGPVGGDAPRTRRTSYTPAGYELMLIPCGATIEIATESSRLLTL